MTITTTDDPIIASDDAQALLDISNDKTMIQTINSLSARFKAYTGRIQINGSLTDPIVEWLRGDGTNRLWLHASPLHLVDAESADLEITVEIYLDNVVQSTYTYNFSEAAADNELVPYSDDTSARLELNNTVFPDSCSQGIVKVTYYGGWLEIPGDVIGGAIMQSKVDENRRKGIVGVTSKGKRAESATYDVGGLVQTVKDMWLPYVVMI